MQKKKKAQFINSFLTFKLQSHKMAKHTQTMQIADELFESVWPFYEIGA